jgi:YEATS domain-containing protein 4
MRWTVAVRSATSPPPGSPILEERVIPEDVIGGCDDISYFVKKVSFKLHDSYPSPLRIVDKPPFEVNETGWGEFIINIKIHFHSESGEKAIQLQHGLKLHDWIPDPNSSIPQVWLDDPASNQDTRAGPASSSIDEPSISKPDPVDQLTLDSSSTETATSKPNTVIHSWQYDEIVFTEPTESFYNKLVAHPPTPLPEKNRFPNGLVKQIGNKGETGEFSNDIASREFKKLNWAELKVLMEIDRLRGKLSSDERELIQIKKFLQQQSS